MKSVKEVSVLTGVSVRTIHYYHELGLLIPTQITEHGYRLYDVKAIMKLQNILLLKELGFSLKEIEKIISNNIKDDYIDKQEERLILKRNRINELIELLEKMKRGEVQMNFREFSTDQFDAAFHQMLEKYNDEQRQQFLDRMGGEKKAQEAFEKTFIENQAALDRYFVDNTDIINLSDITATQNAETRQKKYQDKIEQLNAQLSCHIDEDYTSEIVQQVIYQLEGAYKELFNMNNVCALLEDLGKLYLENEAASSAYDAIYGKGFSHFWGKAVIHHCGLTKANNINM